MGHFTRVHTFQGQTIRELKAQLEVIDTAFDNSEIPWELVMKEPFDKEASIVIKEN